MDTNLNGAPVPPHNLEAEQAVLGAMLLDMDAVLRVMEILRSSSFYDERHQLIFKAIADLSDKGSPVDLVTLADQLRQHKQLEEAGGIGYLAELANVLPSSANVLHYARIVQQKSLLRRLINTASRIIEMSYEEDGDANDVADAAEQMIFQLRHKASDRPIYSIRELLLDTMDDLSRRDKQDGTTGVATKFIDLDRITNGLHPSDLVILAARPSMGKTSLALNIARNAAQNGIGTLIFSVEMSAGQLVERLLALESGVDSQRLRTGFLSENDWYAISEAIGSLSELPIYIDDTPGISVAELRSKARRVKAERDIGLIVIDYLQLMHVRGRVESRQQEISTIARSLKALARELEVPVLSLSQLSRAVEHRQNRRPTLADLRESGELENTADVVMFLYREDYYDQDSERKNITEVIIGKHRNGPTGTVELVFLKHLNRFTSLSSRDEDAALPE